jgi:hypothetical protein
MFQPAPITYKGVASYRGIELGWVAIGGPRNKRDTQRLLSVTNRIWPEYSNKVKVLSYH